MYLAFMKQNNIYIVMGVSGSGKTTIAKQLATQLHYTYIEADDFHSEANKQKMAKGIPLTDADRMPWLQSLHSEMLHLLAQNKPLVLACSALKSAYRDILTHTIEDEVQFIYLKASFDTLYTRMQHRENHFMPAALLQSQFDTLEEPQKAIEVSVAGTVAETMQQLQKVLVF